MNQLPKDVQRGQPCAECQSIDAKAMREQDWIGQHIERLSMSSERIEGRPNILGSPDWDQRSVEAKRA
jgi:hypothetical protein